MASRLTNCHFHMRELEREPLFHFHEDGTATVNMDRYAVLPVEQYERLLSLAEERAAQLTSQLFQRARA